MNKIKKDTIDKVCNWLLNHVGNYVNGEYNEFHHCVEYDGTIDKKRLVEDIRNFMSGE